MIKLRRSPDGTLDELGSDEYGHLEDMGGSWCLIFGAAPRVMVTLYAAYPGRRAVAWVASRLPVAVEDWIDRRIRVRAVVVEEPRR